MLAISTNRDCETSNFAKVCFPLYPACTLPFTSLSEIPVRSVMEHISLLLPNSIITTLPLTQQITLSTLKVTSALQSLPFKLTLTMNQLKHDLVRDHRSFNVQEDLLNVDPVVSSLWRLPWECIKFQNPFSENQGNNTNNQRTRSRKTSVKSVLSAT